MQRAEWEKELDRLGLVVLAEHGEGGTHLALVGNAGSRMWTVFKISPEYADGKPDPLDRWCRRVGQDIAGNAGAEVIFPFEGPPWPPFQAWAEASGASFRSPLAMQVHAEYGLWHAYRFALRFSAQGGKPARSSRSPCLDCADQPCLSACPVEAFSGQEYLVDRCVAYLEENRESSCNTEGCKARHACPAGREFTYEPEHARFHMTAFLNAQRSGSESVAG